MKLDERRAFIYGLTQEYIERFKPQKNDCLRSVVVKKDDDDNNNKEYVHIAAASNKKFLEKCFIYPENEKCSKALLSWKLNIYMNGYG